jgi:hypothetical protein
MNARFDELLKDKVDESFNMVHDRYRNCLHNLMTKSVPGDYELQMLMQRAEELRTVVKTALHKLPKVRVCSSFWLLLESKAGLELHNSLRSLSLGKQNVIRCAYTCRRFSSLG